MVSGTAPGLARNKLTCVGAICLELNRVLASIQSMVNRLETALKQFRPFDTEEAIRSCKQIERQTGTVLTKSLSNFGASPRMPQKDDRPPVPPPKESWKPTGKPPVPQPKQHCNVLPPSPTSPYQSDGNGFSPVPGTPVTPLTDTSRSTSANSIFQYSKRVTPGALGEKLDSLRLSTESSEPKPQRLSSADVLGKVLNQTMLGDKRVSAFQVSVQGREDTCVHDRRAIGAPTRKQEPIIDVLGSIATSPQRPVFQKRHTLSPALLGKEMVSQVGGNNLGLSEIQDHTARTGRREAVGQARRVPSVYDFHASPLTPQDSLRMETKTPVAASSPSPLPRSPLTKSQDTVGEMPSSLKIQNLDRRAKRRTLSDVTAYIPYRPTTIRPEEDEVLRHIELSAPPTAPPPPPPVSPRKGLDIQIQMEKAEPDTANRDITRSMGARKSYMALPEVQPKEERRNLARKSFMALPRVQEPPSTELPPKNNVARKSFMILPKMEAPPVPAPDLPVNPPYPLEDTPPIVVDHWAHTRNKTSQLAQQHRRTVSAQVPRASIIPQYQEHMQQQTIRENDHQSLAPIPAGTVPTAAPNTTQRRPLHHYKSYQGLSNDPAPGPRPPLPQNRRASQPPTSQFARPNQKLPSQPSYHQLRESAGLSRTQPSPPLQPIPNPNKLQRPSKLTTRPRSDSKPQPALPLPEIRVTQQLDYCKAARTLQNSVYKNDPYLPNDYRCTTCDSVVSTGFMNIRTIDRKVVKGGSFFSVKSHVPSIEMKGGARYSCVVCPQGRVGEAVVFSYREDYLKHLEGHSSKELLASGGILKG